MNESSEEMAAESGDETLTRLGDALGQPPLSMVENAKALFSFISDEDDARADDPVPAASAVSAAQADRIRG